MSPLPFWLLRQVGDGALTRNVFAQFERVEQYVEEKFGAIYALPTVWLEEFDLVRYGPRAVHRRNTPYSSNAVIFRIWLKHIRCDARRVVVGLHMIT